MTTNPNRAISEIDDSVGRAAWYFIVGQGRSGSTLLGNLLTDAVGGFHCGELQSLWEGLANDRLCTCGEELVDCELWSSVVSQVCDSMGFKSVDEAITASRRRTRQRNLLKPRPPRPTEDELTLRSATEKAVETVTGAATIVDSSKVPPTMWAAVHLDRPLTVIHLFRDPRGVAYSWEKVTPDPSQRTGYMMRRSAWRSATAWNVINITTSHLLRKVPNVTSLEVRYETFVQDLGKELERITGRDGSTAHPAEVHVASQHGEIGHAIGGNPRRFRQEEIKLDTRWQTEMPSGPMLACTIATSPLLRRFGYSLRPPRRQAEEQR